MKKKLFLICMMISITMRAMEDSKMQSAYNSDDDALEENHLSDKNNKLLSEVDAITQNLTALHLQAKNLEETICSNDGLRMFTLLKGLNFKLSREAQKIRKKSLKAELAGKRGHKRDKKSYIKNTLYFDRLKNEEKVLLEAIKGMETFIERGAASQAARQRAIMRDDPVQQSSSATQSTTP